MKIKSLIIFALILLSLVVFANNTTNDTVTIDVGSNITNDSVAFDNFQDLDIKSEFKNKIKDKLNKTKLKKIKDLVSKDDLKKIRREIQQLSENESKHVIVQYRKNVRKRARSLIKDNKQNLKFDKVNSKRIKELVKDSNVEKIWPDRVTKSQILESSKLINVDYLRELDLFGSNIKIAILDTGIEAGHEMLSGVDIISKDFTNSGNTKDHYGHGTHVAGIIAGNSQYVGVSPNVTIYNAKVLDDNGYGRLSYLISAIDWAIENNVDVISMSLGATYDGNPEDLLSAPEVLKVEEAISLGITVVIASGNCNDGSCGSFNSVTTPAIARNAITVGAVGSNLEHASFSSGSIIADYIKPDVVAPGVDVCSSYIGNTYECLSGTSMATPFVSGIVALLKEYDEDLTPFQIKELLEEKATDLGVDGKDKKYGSGFVNLSNLDLVNFESRITSMDFDIKIDNVSIYVDVNDVDYVDLEIYHEDSETIAYFKDDFTYSFEPSFGTYRVVVKAYKGEEVQVKEKEFSIQNYKLDVPTIFVGSDNIIGLEYFNTDSTNNVSVNFRVNEFENKFLSNQSLEVLENSSSLFEFEFSPRYPGKHFLEVKMNNGFREQIIFTKIDVYTNELTSTMSDLKLRSRG